ncbi:MAG: (2Fe-2S)-binding protein [Gemmatimonadales bacterium]|nr:MAG: (2Fe-2S)-binding protein [Gemmatimonadales bacterium]
MTKTADTAWHDLGDAHELAQVPLQQVLIGRTRIALSHSGGQFSAVSGTCNHAGGPLGDGQLDGEYIVCPWHHWKFHRVTGEGEPGFGEDRVPRYEVTVEEGRVLVNLEAVTKRHVSPHDPHPLARKVVRAPGSIRVVGISTTAMDEAYPRSSTSDALLSSALEHAGERLSCETELIRLSALSFRSCEGYYSKSAQACTWPCSITQMDPDDQLDRVYEALVHWADVVLVATPIRWGAASALYYKMAERLNCVQNQVTIRNRVLIQNKVASFIVTGGQDNVQAVVGQLLTFFGELGYLFPQFPFIAHSRGWTAEDMENNVLEVMNSTELHEGAAALIDRAVGLASTLLDKEAPEHIARGGRKAHPLA